jgi:hypothetical protein
MTLFTVSHLLCQWEAQGIVSARREVVLVDDVLALTELCREELGGTIPPVSFPLLQNLNHLEIVAGLLCPNLRKATQSLPSPAWCLGQPH